MLNGEGREKSKRHWQLGGICSIRNGGEAARETCLKLIPETLRHYFTDNATLCHPRLKKTATPPVMIEG